MICKYKLFENFHFKLNFINLHIYKRSMYLLIDIIILATSMKNALIRLGSLSPDLRLELEQRGSFLIKKINEIKIVWKF